MRPKASGLRPFASACHEKKGNKICKNTETKRLFVLVSENNSSMGRRNNQRNGTYVNRRIQHQLSSNSPYQVHHDMCSLEYMLDWMGQSTPPWPIDMIRIDGLIPETANCLATTIALGRSKSWDAKSRCVQLRFRANPMASTFGRSITFSSNQKNNLSLQSSKC